MENRWKIPGILIPLKNKISKCLEKKGLVVIYNSDSKIINLINKVKNEVEFLMKLNEAYFLYNLVKATNKVKGDIAEIGCYEGGSSKIICEARDETKKVYLFDTFAGLPETDRLGGFKKGICKAEYKKVKEYLKSYKDVYIYKGVFPETAKPIKNKSFSFIHLDVDTYKSTLKSLEFFYPRMNKNGIILTHDYIKLGVKKAFQEFFKNKKEVLIESYSQCLIVKTGGLNSSQD